MTDFDFRFGGLQRLYGKEMVERFRSAHIAVIGIGGVGSWVAESLARSAIGELTLIDLDDVCTSNINRQICALDTTVGKMKIEVMAERIHQINPAAKVNLINDFITADNVDRLLSMSMNVVVDAIDSVKPKAALIAHCKRQKIPVIMVGGAGGQKDPTRVQVKDLNRTQQDPLAAKVRSELRRFYNFSRNPKRRYGVECVHSEEQLTYPMPDGTVCQTKSFTDGSTRLDCASGFGATSTVTATFGLVAAARALEKLMK